MVEKFILDACCSVRGFWKNKKHKNTVYMDIRKEVNPDIIGDFRDMPFPDKRFRMVIWDPPHIIDGRLEDFKLAKRYGVLNPESWQGDLKKGFKECWRVLEDYGVLVFKWSHVNRWAQKQFDAQIKHLIELFEIEPLVVQKTSRIKEEFGSFWATYMKIPYDEHRKSIQWDWRN